MAAIKVLVIDDNQAHAEGLAELLGLAGFESCHALTGSDGLRLAQEKSIDAVLLDMNLPGMNGREVCRRLRNNPETANIAIVFHTGQDRMPDGLHGADSFLTYPVAMVEVYSVIRGCVERRKSKVAG